MKKAEIKNFTFAEVDAPNEQFGFLKIPAEHKLIRCEGENLEISDGHHTFAELYDHRFTLYIALCRVLKQDADHNGIWRSKLQSDGTMPEGWFIMGINKRPGEQITYHLPLARWDETDFAETLDRAPEWDRHTSDDVLARLKLL
jgi:hypothetical protein